MSASWASDAATAALAVLVAFANVTSGPHAKLHVAGVRPIAVRGVNLADTTADSLGSGPIVVDDAGAVVRFLSDIEVRPGDHIDGDVVAIFGRVHVAGSVTGSTVSVFGGQRIEPGARIGGSAVSVLGGERCGGTVEGDAVAVLGMLDLAPGATVGGDAVSVGGHVRNAEGATIRGSDVSVPLFPLTLGLPLLPAVLALIALGWGLTVVLGWLMGALFAGRLARVAAMSSRRTFVSLVLGTFSMVGWPTLATLVMATIVGLPVGLLMWLAFPLLVFAGKLSGTYVLGCKLLRRRLGEGGALGPMAAGAGLVAACLAVAAVCFSSGGATAAVGFFFGCVALLVTAGLTLIGTGAILLSRGGSAERTPAAQQPAPAAAPAPGA